MCKFNPKNEGRRIDPCMINIIENLKNQSVRTLGCCCGHKKYPMSIVIDIGLSKTLPLEIFSNKQLPRKNRFYFRDKNGVYYIPETLKTKQ